MPRPRTRRRVVATIAGGAALLATTVAARAHLPVLLVDRPWVKKGDTVSIGYRFGHPFEAEYVDVARPVAVGAVTPAGERVDLAGGLAERAIGEGEGEHRAWGLTYEPKERGDHVIFLEGAPAPHGRDLLYVDLVKLVLHVQAQDGWDARVGHPVEIVPLTRPYGIPVGGAFRAVVERDGAPLAGVAVEVERYNRAAPAALPPEELITRVEKTDAGGAFTATLDAPGWWVLAAEAEAGEVEHEAEKRTRVQRACLWVFVGAP